MSSLKVRTEFRTALTNWLAANSPTTPFHETINTRQDPTEETWVTAEFMADYSERLTIGCNDKEEFGQVDVFVYSRAGKGDAVALTLAERIAAGLENLSSNGVSVDRVEPPSEAFNGDALHWYGVYISFDYIFNS